MSDAPSAEKDAACPVCGLDYLTECSCTRQPPPDAEKDAPVVTYDDDRYGMMRVHIAARRADLACENYTRNALRNFAKAKGLTPSSSRKRDLAWRMAQAGLICRNGYLRDGFPTRPLPPGGSDA